MEGRVGNQLGLSYFYCMTITIPEHLGYEIPSNGIQLDFVGGPQQKGTITSFATSAVALSVSGTATYEDGSTESVALVPELRPFRCAALHVVGRSFVDAIPLDDRRIQRFL